MAESCLLYYITDRTAFAPDEPNRRSRLLEKIAEAARTGVDYIQLREKDLPTRELESLARDAMSAIREARKPASGPWPATPALLINSRTDVALAVGADGIHLRSDDVSPRDVKAVWECSCGADTLVRQHSAQAPLIGVSCHSPEEVAQAAINGASFAVFGPIFEKQGAPHAPSAGPNQLREACRVSIPVLAIGGVTLDNARSCLEAGAAGIAAIRLFQENAIAEIVNALRAS
jgi:thiamine-phosphate pyrophosphorylase